MVTLTVCKLPGGRMEEYKSSNFAKLGRDANQYIPIYVSNVVISVAVIFPT